MMCTTVYRMREFIREVGRHQGCFLSPPTFPKLLLGRLPSLQPMLSLKQTTAVEPIPIGHHKHQTLHTKQTINRDQTALSGS